MCPLITSGSELPGVVPQPQVAAAVWDDHVVVPTELGILIAVCIEQVSSLDRQTTLGEDLGDGPVSVHGCHQRGHHFGEVTVLVLFPHFPWVKLPLYSPCTSASVRDLIVAVSCRFAKVWVNEALVAIRSRVAKATTLEKDDPFLGGRVFLQEKTCCGKVIAESSGVCDVMIVEGTTRITMEVASQEEDYKYS